MRYWAPIAATVLSLTCGATAWALVDRVSVEGRLKTLETQRAVDSDRLKRVEEKMDLLLERVRP